MDESVKPPSTTVQQSHPRSSSAAQQPKADASLMAGLAFDQVDAPRVSIILPACRSLALTIRCLRSIQLHRSQVPHEVLAVGDESDDPALVELSLVPGLHYHPHPERLGFAGSCNTAATLARGEYLFFLGSDTEVTAGWLDAALEMFAQFPDIGAVGAKLQCADGRLQAAGGIIWADGAVEPVGHGEQADGPEFNYPRPADYVSAAALMVRVDLYAGAGGFDPVFVCPDYASADLCLRLRQRGSGVYYCPRAVVTAGASAPTAQLPPRHDAVAGAAAGDRDRHALRQRWRPVLERRHYRNGPCQMRARDHGRHRRHVLVMDHTIPQPDRDAGSRAMLQTMLQLTRMGMVVKFWPDDHLYGPQYRQLLDDAGIEVVTGDRWGRSFEEYLQQAGETLDFAVLSRPNFAGPYIPLLRRHSRARLVFFGHDIHHLRMLGQADLTGDAQVRAEAEAMRKVEMDIWQAVDSIIYPSPEEADVVAASVGMARSHAVPVYALDSALSLMRRPSPSQDLLFVAGFGHPPNEDAAEWLVRCLFPQVKARFPGARIRLVGSHPTARVMALADHDVSIFANVTDEQLADHYATATVALAPLRFGGGVKLKIVEAMAHGIPLVTTSVGAQGLPDVAHCIAVADDAGGLVDAVARLLQDPAQALQSALAARDYVRTHYSAQKMENALWRALVGESDGWR